MASEGKPKRLADVVAEMRSFGDNRIAEGKTGISAECVGLIAHQFANMIEEAVRAETGNGAAMRDVLEEALDMLRDMQMGWRSPISNQAYALKRKMKAALVEPPRNCDAYGPKADIYGVYCYWISTPEGHDPEGRPTMSYGSWLLANAKGGKCDADAKQD